ncbi:hypothetical protein BSL82_04860 [Tardibacter chloracetimidivorans]|uniref:Ketoreductase domain-containing protein n=1 Tax=Tardibacter chloracetimidivorans TaxID=1921510 RepID=A0A1L3ZSY1_9SPHN|nr:hypothetical protein BSL82_04860 [Tardibacter chloracetimidivorans]
MKGGALQEWVLRDLNGKSVIVTGGASGIGRSTALLLAEAGALITVADRNEAGCTETVEMIGAKGGVAQSCGIDVTSESAVRDLVQLAVSRFGGLHGAANAAGIVGSSIAIEDMPLEEWSRVISINLTAQFLCLKYQARAMLDTGGGSIVMVSSTASMIGFPLTSAYCASKAGVLGLVRSASCEYSKRGVRVNALLPGATRTPMFEGAMAASGLEDYVAATHPIGRFAEPDEIGRAIRWLISDEASYVTGSAMAVDGGNTSI